MTVRRDPTKVMQIGFLALLSISAATVGWWMYDHVRYARSVEQRFAEYDPAVVEDSDARINRVLWEGGFFLVVLDRRHGRADAHACGTTRSCGGASRIFSPPCRTSSRARSRASSSRPRRSCCARATTTASGSGGAFSRTASVCLRMIDNLLDTTRLEEGRQRLTPQLTNLACRNGRGRRGDRRPRAGERHRARRARCRKTSR